MFAFDSLHYRIFIVGNFLCNTQIRYVDIVCNATSNIHSSLMDHQYIRVVFGILQVVIKYTTSYIYIIDQSAMHKKVTDFGAQPKPILFLHCAHLVLESCVILMLGEVDLRIRGRSSGSWRNILRSEIVSSASLSELNVLAASVISGVKWTKFLSDHRSTFLDLE